MGFGRSELIYLVALFVLLWLALSVVDRAGISAAPWLVGLMGAAASIVARRIARLR